MSLFGPPNIMKLEKKYDYSGLIKAAHYRREPDIRIQALEALTSRNLLYSKESAKFQKEIASLLADLAKNDPDPNVQVAAVRGIQKLGNKYGAMDAARLQVIELAGLFNNYLNIGADNLAAEVVAALLSLEPSKKILPSDAETTNNLVTFLTRQISQGKLQSAGQTAMLLMNGGHPEEIAAGYTPGIVYPPVQGAAQPNRQSRPHTGIPRNHSFVDEISLTQLPGSDQSPGCCGSQGSPSTPIEYVHR
jgi:hypothetical protein